MPVWPRVTPARLLVALTAFCSASSMRLASLFTATPPPLTSSPSSPDSRRCGVRCRPAAAAPLLLVPASLALLALLVLLPAAAGAAPAAVAAEALSSAALLSALGARRLGLSPRGGFHWDFPVAWLNQ
jgi:hypothetical protein